MADITTRNTRSVSPASSSDKPVLRKPLTKTSLDLVAAYNAVRDPTQYRFVALQYIGARKLAERFNQTDALDAYLESQGVDLTRLGKKTR